MLINNARLNRFRAWSFMLRIAFDVLEKSFMPNAEFWLASFYLNYHLCLFYFQGQKYSSIETKNHKIVGHKNLKREAIVILDKTQAMILISIYSNLLQLCILLIKLLISFFRGILCGTSNVVIIMPSSVYLNRISNE